jgi:hypothetical protein
MRRGGRSYILTFCSVESEGGMPRYAIAQKSSRNASAGYEPPRRIAERAPCDSGFLRHAARFAELDEFLRRVRQALAFADQETRVDRADVTLERANANTAAACHGSRRV